LAGGVAIAAPDVAAAGRLSGTIIDLVVDAAVVGTDEVALIVAAMVTGAAAAAAAIATQL